MDERSHRYDHDRRTPSKASQSARLAAAVVLSFMCVAHVLAGMKDGYAAYESGDYETALKEFRTLAEHGDPAAQIAVGWLYDAGKGVAHDDTEAIRWYTMAAEQGCAVAQQYLGTMYASGSGVPRNFETARKWFRAAADQGDAGGLYGLGVMYRDGDGVTADPAAAYLWFALAAVHGGADPNAKLAAAARAKLGARLTGNQEHDVEAAALLILASVPFALIGGFWLMYALGHAMSVATAVGFIALAGVSSEFGVIMLLYLKHAWERRLAAGEPTNATTLLAAIRDGAVQRVRPKAMTVAVILAGLLPIMLGHGTGSEIMQRIAAPMVGGMITAPLLSMLVIPVVYFQIRRNKSPSRLGERSEP